MSRHRQSTFTIASLSVALILSAALQAVRPDALAYAGSPHAGATWQAADDTENPFRSNSADGWSPVRPRQTGTTESDSEAPSASSNKRRPHVLQASATSPWQLPNRHTNAGNRPPQQHSPPTAAREPLPFHAPSNATRLSSAAPRTSNVPPWSTASNVNTRPTATWPPQAGYTTPRSSAMNHNMADDRSPRSAGANNHYYPAYNSTSGGRPTTPGRMAADPRAHDPPSTNRPAPRGAAAIGRKVDSYTGRVWDTIAVAFQEPESLLSGETETQESLPAPRGTTNQSAPTMQDGMMPEGMTYDGQMSGPMFGEGYGYGEPGGCPCSGGCCECGPTCGDGMCGCGPGCGCGCCGEVGCGCEPGCGCSNGGCDINFCGEGDPAACTTLRIGVPKWQEFTVFGGVQGFKGPYDQERDSGNFGFHEGFNSGFKLPFTHMGYQIGYRATQSQLNGDIDTNISDPHTQQFVTAGIFQRAKNGFQGGIVWDMLRDERWNAVDFHQLRVELSMIDNGCHEIGFAGMFHLNDDEQLRPINNGSTTLYQATDQYLAFYRFHGRQGGEGRFYAGVNDNSDGIIGADMFIPLQPRWSLVTGFTYFIPHQDSGRIGAAEEAWNISTGLVWHWGCRARSSFSNCYRPLFQVADNGSLIIDDRIGAPPIGDDFEE